MNTYSDYVCRKCGFILHTDILPFKYLNTKCPQCNNEEFEGVKCDQKNQIPHRKDSRLRANTVPVHGKRNDTSASTENKTQKVSTNEAWLAQFSIDELVNYDFFFSNVVGQRLFNDHYLRRVFK